MKFSVLFILLAVCAISGLFGQGVFGNDFGTGTSSFTTAGGSNSTMFTAATGGTHTAFMSASGGGGFFLENSGIVSFGSETKLRIKAPTTSGANGINKYSCAGYNSKPSAYFKTQLRFGNATGGNSDGGTFYFYYGRGTSFTTNVPGDHTIGSQTGTYLALRFVLGPNGTINTNYLLAGQWTAFGSQPFVQGKNYTIELRMNNGPGNSTTTYTENGVTQSCTDYRTDFFVNGVLFGNDLATAGLGPQKDLESWMFYGENSGGNDANLFIDGLTYTINIGTVAYPLYYSKSTGALNLNNTWGGLADGTGSAPTSFTSTGQGFFIHNNPAPTLSANWTVAGAGTLVSLGNGVLPTVFTIPSNYYYYGSIDVLANAILDLKNTINYPSFGVFFPGSTIRYSATGNQDVRGYHYDMLSIRGGGTKTLLGSTSVDTFVEVGDGTNPVTLVVPSGSDIVGTVNVLNVATLDLKNSGYITLGNVASGSLVRYSALGNQLVFPAAFSKMDIDGIGTKSLNGVTSVNSALLINAGELALGTYNLSLPGTASGIGYIKYNDVGRASGVGIGANTNFRLTQAGTITVTMPPVIGNMDVNSTGSITMGGNTSVQNLMLNSALSIGSTTLTVNNAISGAGTLVGGSSSNLVMTGATASTSIPAVTLSNLTISRASGIAMGGNITVESSLNLTAGLLNIGANTLTLNGSVASSSGLTGGTSSSVVIGGTASNMTLPIVSSLASLSVTRPSAIALSSILTINTNLNMSSGSSITSTATNTLTFASGATGSGTGTVNGHVRQNATTVVAGSPYSNRYIGMALSPASGIVSSLTILKTELANSILSRNSILRSWNVSATASAPCQISLSWPDTADNGNSQAYGTIWFHNGSTWSPVSTHTINTVSGIRTISFDFNFGSRASGIFTVMNAVPQISTSVSTLPSFGQFKVSTLSSPQTYTISGAELYNNLQIDAPVGFLISTTDSNYSSQVVVNQTGGTVPLTTIFVKFAPQSLGIIVGNISHVSSGATSVNVAVSGTAINAPIVSNPAVVSVLPNGAVLGGTITSINYGNCTARGIYYSLQSGFANGEGILISESGTFDTGAFSIEVGSLSVNTVYYFKAFATNAAGTAYTAEGIFTTLAGYFFRSFSSGNWSSPAIWEYSANNLNWTPAPYAPSFTDLQITIMPGHSVSVITNVTVDELSVSTGANLTVNSGSIMNVNNGLNDDVIVNGTITNKGSITFDASATMIAGNSSTVIYNGTVAQVLGSGFPTSLNNFTISNSGGVTLSHDLQVNGTLSMTQGTVNLDGNTISYGSSAVLNYDGTIGQTVGAEWLNPMSININNHNSSASGLTLTDSKIYNTGTFVNYETLHLGSNNISGTGTVINLGRIVSDNASPITTATFNQQLGAFIQYTTQVSLPVGAVYQNLELTSTDSEFSLSGDIVVNESFFTHNNARLNLNGFRMIFPFKYVSVEGSVSITAFAPETYSEQIQGGFVSRKWSFTGAPAVSPTIYLHWDNDQDDDVIFGNGSRILKYSNGWEEIALAGQPVADGVNRKMVSFPTTLGSKADVNGEYAVMGTEQTLPVELSSFQASINSMNMVNLLWVTQSETNVSGFRVYRGSEEELSTATLLNTFISATNTSQTQVYMFNDREIYTDGLYYYWLESLDIDGGSEYHGPISIMVNQIVNGTPQIPVINGISRAYPNPFNPVLNVSCGIKTNGNTNIVVFNQRGQIVKNLYNGFKNAGNFTLKWDGTDTNGTKQPSGIYFIRMEVSGEKYIKKVVLSK